jgi:hypothetical protein
LNDSLSRMFAACALAAVAAGASPSLAAWTEVMKEQTATGVSGVTETRWQLERPRGENLDRIQVHRYRGRGESRAALLYLPGMHMNGFLPGRRGDVIYAQPSEQHNLWLFLAKRGVEVFALDYRSHFVSTERADHAFMREWTLERYVNDAKEALELVRTQSGRAHVFVTGFSMGVTVAYGLVNVVSAEELAGLIVLDGAFKRPPGGGAFDRVRAFAMMEKLGRWSIDVGGGMGFDGRKALMAAVIEDPDRPRADRLDETVGARLGRLLARSGWAYPGVHSDVQILAALLITEDRYFPGMVAFEGRSVASLDDDPGTSVDDAFGNVDIPVIYFGATGFGPQSILAGVYSAVRLGGEDVTLHLQEGWGHLEVLAGNEARREIYEPLLDWINVRAKSADE